MDPTRYAFGIDKLMVKKDKVTLWTQLVQKRAAIIILAIFLLFVFLRFFELEDRLQFTWDQIQNAWVMKDILDDEKWPLLGMPAKLNAGFSIGPAYYYLLLPFYKIFDLDPIASGVFAGVAGGGG